MDASQISAADAFVVAMLTMMALSLGIIGLLILCMRRNAAKRDRMVDELIEEAAEEEKRANQRTPTDDVAKTEPWEREADWWKK